MTSFKKQIDTDYQQFATGTWGRFNTPAGAIDFLETKARIGVTSPDAETRLTRFLKPVREALSTQEMDFNQLLQRDLDDHRVATELVPYLLQPSSRGPAFFPPIVTALLPFDGPKPLHDFPEQSDIKCYESTDAWWKGYSFGNAFKFEKIVNSDGTPHGFKIGRLSWNDENAQLVVIDGQHRAMALLAIHRTINRLWEGQGEKYKHFYESSVQDVLRGMSDEVRDKLFADIELPVTILWFPNIRSTTGSHQRAARKLFVDVNKNARPPSESRVLLLSDTDLCAILTRRVLNTFRNNDSTTLPISAIEYDHPERDQASSAKWSAITNVSIIHSCLYRAIFGPKKYINDLESNFRGKENDTEGAKYMHSSLQIGDVIEEVVEDGDQTIRREDISRTKFPRTSLGKIEGQLMAGWGELIVRMLSDLQPYKAHGEALSELRKGWSGSDSTGRLASDAIFEGVGMYWTLRESQNHWRARNKIRGETDLPPLSKTDIVHAWEETEKKREQFDTMRAKYYLGSESNRSVEASKGSYAVFCTHACQLGFVLAVRSLADIAEVPFEKVKAFIGNVIDGANAGLMGDAAGEFGRKAFLWRDAPSPLNQIPKLDSPFAVYFRYFWLELLGSKESRPFVLKTIDSCILDDSIKVARRHYFKKLCEIYKVSLKSGHPDWTSTKVEAAATSTAEKELFKALKKWFGIEQNDFDSWKATVLESQKDDDSEEFANGDRTEGSAMMESGEVEESLEDLLNDDEI